MKLSEEEINLNLEIIKFLLENGADRTLKGVDNLIAIKLAEEHIAGEKIIEHLEYTE